jgi:hypothetical protein
MMNLIIFKYTMYMLKRHKVEMISSEGDMPIRDRPFNLQGGYGFLFRSEFFFLTTRELEY